jgi:hypothetical protein
MIPPGRARLQKSAAPDTPLLNLPVTVRGLSGHHLSYQSLLPYNLGLICSPSFHRNPQTTRRPGRARSLFVRTLPRFFRPFTPRVQAARSELRSPPSWHCNRYTFASKLVMAGVDFRAVAELLGHGTLRMFALQPSRARAPGVGGRPTGKGQREGTLKRAPVATGPGGAATKRATNDSKQAV